MAWFCQEWFHGAMYCSAMQGKGLSLKLKIGIVRRAKAMFGAAVYGKAYNKSIERNIIPKKII